MDWLCRRAHQLGSLVSIESTSSCLWKVNEEKYETRVNILDAL